MQQGHGCGTMLGVWTMLWLRLLTAGWRVCTHKL
jgi:hypothetical protein